jgi:hypothetical protein
VNLGGSIDRLNLVLLEEVPLGLHNTVTETAVGEGLEDGGAHVEVRVTAARAAVDNDGVDRLAVGLDPNSLTAVVAVVPVVETLADGNDHVAVDGVPAACGKRTDRSQRRKSKWSGPDRIEIEEATHSYQVRR